MGNNSAMNYTEQGGTVTHIGGKLVFDEGASIEGFPLAFTKAETQPASEATTVAALREDFNQLLLKLKAAGVMEAEDAS